MLYQQQQAIRKIYGVVVLYKVKLDDSITLSSLDIALLKANLRLDLLVYDNSPNPLYQAKAFQYKSFNINYIHNSLNPGVSTAYNKAASLAKDFNKEWLLILDDDTKFQEDAIITYIEAIEEYGATIPLFAPRLYHYEKKHLISPSYVFFRRGILMKEIKIGFHTMKNRMVINSGLCINLVVFNQVGGYNEKVRMYASDYAFIYRYKRHYQQFYVLDAKSFHKSSMNDLGQDLPQLVNRFAMRCEGNRNVAESFGELILYGTHITLRMLKLSFIFKTFTFAVVYLKHFIQGKKVNSDQRLIERAPLNVIERIL